ncbi:MAG: SDR family oxidoreductase [Stackebrandtia sp.]
MGTASRAERVLVTGATGFIAGHCVHDLLERGYAVRGTVRPGASADKTAHLRQIAERVGGSLEIVEADLGDDRGWKEAVAGCAYVLHVASPFPPGPPDDENDVVGPAVAGAKRVLHACADDDGVRRVVMTSSVAAVIGGHDQADPTVRTEADWAIPERCDAYRKSKTLAERAAWELVDGLPEDRRFEFAVVLPGMCLGPLLNADANTSLQAVKKLMAREMPGVPRLGFATVDVRDVAAAHLLAMERPEAPGNRYILAGENIWMREIAELLAAEFGPAGYRVPTREMPNWMVRIAARFDKTVRLVVSFLGQGELVSPDKAIRELGWSMRPAKQTIIDTGYSLIDHELVPAPKSKQPAAVR